ncbi:hypothetical protein D5086_003711, partial [Populus alba]
TLDLSSNTPLSGTLPEFPIGSKLEVLSLMFTSFSGEIPYSIGNLQFLIKLDLRNCSFSGLIPSSLASLNQLNLTELKLFSNNFSGAINLSMIKSIESLAFLQLSDNSQLTIAYSSNLKLPQLQTLWFDSCNVSRIPSFLRNQDGLVELGLSNNKIQGILPKWIWQLESLSYLNLSNNFLTGIETPVLAPLFSSLTLLDLSSNFLEGSFPIFPPSVNLLSLSKNKFTGKLPVSFCNMNSLAILDISYNHLTGQIPQCLGNLSSALTVVNLRENQFSGSMLWNFTEECSLTTLNLYRNQLKGEIPA